MKVSILAFMLSVGAFSELSELSDAQKLCDNLRIEGIREHQKALQDLSRSSGGNRMAGSEGYKQSVAYVAARLRASGYNVILQDFTLRIASDQSPAVLKKLAPQEHDFAFNSDFSSMSYSGSQEVTGLLEAIDLKIPLIKSSDSSSGCEASDFALFKPGNIALIQRGSCSFSKKVALAKKAGALGVIIFNDGSEGHTELISTRLDSDSADFPVLATTFEVGNALRQNILHGSTGIIISVKVDVDNGAKIIQNIIAETPHGDPNRVVAVGAHLDSVHSGAGINDNGSGSAAILEIAELYADLKLQPKNKVRFLWFGAEEFGLVGSEFYVKSLNNAEKQKIMAMLNFDMLGSPNYARFVYDGDNSSQSELYAAAGPEGSAAIEKIFLDYFASHNMPTHPTAFNGRSDYGPFIHAGIPAGGLFSGAEGIKSPRLAQIYGGEAHVSFDPCYHRSCDNFQGTNSPLALKSLTELSQAAAHATGILGSSDQEIRTPQSMPVITPEPLWEYKGSLLVR